jgi:hypothetical protein
MISERDFQGLREFYRMYPFDDYHRFHRPAALVAGAMAGGDMAARLEWLQPDTAASPATGTPQLPSIIGDYSSADLSVMVALGVTPPKG